MYDLLQVGPLLLRLANLLSSSQSMIFDHTNLCGQDIDGLVIKEAELHMFTF